MEYKKIKYCGYENKELTCYVWQIDNPIAIVQIIHGMQEHATRYDDFAKFLNDKGYTVYASDLRGHGENIIDGKHGYSDGDITYENIMDQIKLSGQIKKQYPDIPLYVFGHSYGSMITQNYITRTQYWDKAVICGSTYTNNFLFRMGRNLANATAKFKGRDVHAKMVESMSFGAYGKKFEDGNWLTRDKDMYEKYKNDEYCGKPFPACFYQSMFKNFLKNYKYIDNVDKNKPVFIIAGDHDPVGNYGRDVKRLYNFYKKCGLNAVMKLYPDCRHELINELNRQDVYMDVLNFLKK